MQRESATDCEEEIGRGRRPPKGGRRLAKYKGVVCWEAWQQTADEHQKRAIANAQLLARKRDGKTHYEPGASIERPTRTPGRYVHPAPAPG